MKYSKSRRRNLISISITLLIILMLIISGPASAVLITMTPPPDHTVGETVTFTVDIKLRGSDLIDIQNISVTNLPLGNISFYPNGTQISGNSGYTVTQTKAANYSYGPRYGIDDNPESPDYGYGFDFGSGYGHGQPGEESHLIYNIDISGLPVGTYTDDVHIDVFVAGNSTKLAFSVVEDYDFKINPKPTSTSGTSGGGGSVGTSGETFENIVCSETDRRFISKDQEVSFNFELECNYVKYVNFTGLSSFGKEATKVEILKDTSSLVSIDAPDVVFTNLNVWIGSMGLVTENKVIDPTISFYVDKSWVKDNGITLNTIYFSSYDASTKNWEKMSTQKIGEDSSSYYFKASLPLRTNIGPMAISGRTSSMPVSFPTPTPSVVPNQTEPEPAPEITPIATPITWTSSWKETIPGFQASVTILIIIVSYIAGRKRD